MKLFSNLFAPHFSWISVIVIVKSFLGLTIGSWSACVRQVMDARGRLLTDCLSVAKTEFMAIDSHQRIRASRNEEINGKSITRAHKVKSRGLLIDEHFTWKDHVDEVVKKISKAIGALKLYQ